MTTELTEHCPEHTTSIRIEDARSVELAAQWVLYQGDRMDEHYYYDRPASPDPALYCNALSSAYWLETGAQELLDELEANTRHLFHRLLYHLEMSFEEYEAAKAARDTACGINTRDEPGKSGNDPTYTYKNSFLGTLVTNVGVSIDALAARSLYFVTREIAAGKTVTTRDITEHTADAFPRVRYITGAHKGTGSREAEKLGLQPQLAATGLARRLAAHLEQTRTAEKLLAPFLLNRTVYDVDGCPASALKRGPLIHSGVCHGNLNIPVCLDPLPTRRRISSFAENVGLWHEMRTGVCNMSAITLGMAKLQLETLYFPRLVELVAAHNRDDELVGMMTQAGMLQPSA